MSNKAINWCTGLAIKPAPKATLFALCDALNEKTGQCNPSATVLAKKTGFQLRSIRRHITLLENEGYIAVNKRVNKFGAHVSNEYQILIGVQEGVTQSHPPSDSLSPSPSDSLSPAIKEPENIKPESKPSIVERDDNDFEKEFLELWEEWKPFDMSKGNKRTALKIYTKHRLKGVSNEDIKRGCKSYIDRCHKIMCKTKHFSSWLEQHGWEDECLANKIDLTKGNNGSLYDDTQNALSETDSLWHSILREELTNAVYQSWIRPLRYENGKIICPNSFVHDWCNNHYFQKIERAVKQSGLKFSGFVVEDTQLDANDVLINSKEGARNGQ